MDGARSPEVRCPELADSLVREDSRSVSRKAFSGLSQQVYVESVAG